jgi:phenylacetic acid degradation protein
VQIYKLNDLVPVINNKAFIHETAVIIGDVFIDEGVYIGPLASIRGDFGRIIIKKNANVQDCCVIHSFPNIDVVIEENGHIGHSAILHGCHIKYNAMVGMGSVIMDEAIIGENSIIGASSLVPSKMIIPDNHLAFGNPAKVKRELKEQEINWKKDGSKAYTNLAYNCIDNLKKCAPLKESNEKRESLRCDMHYKPKHT